MLPTNLTHLTVLPPLVTQHQFAYLIGESSDTVRGWVESKTVPRVKVGKRNMINLKRISDDMAAGKTVFSRGDYCD